MPLKRLGFEQNLWKKGNQIIAGVDEAGRGPLAGPLVAAAVVLNKTHITRLINTYSRNNDVELEDENNLEKVHFLNYGRIKDSKKLSEKNREELFLFIKGVSISYSIVEIPPKEIDKIGVGEANKIALSKSVGGLKILPQYILSDHYPVETWDKNRQLNISKGDDKSLSIAAASILAKVYRDKIMLKMHEKYPDYHFHKHKGYGTKFHREKILEIGPCNIHRRSFEPTKSYLANNNY